MVPPFAITLYFFATFLMDSFISLIALGNGDEVGLQWINPIIIYNHVPVNWFGCLVLTIAAHVAAGPWVVLYWFYKLCTVGRK